MVEDKSVEDKPNKNSVKKENKEDANDGKKGDSEKFVDKKETKEESESEGTHKENKKKPKNNDGGKKDSKDKDKTEQEKQSAPNFPMKRVAAFASAVVILLLVFLMKPTAATVSESFSNIEQYTYENGDFNPKLSEEYEAHFSDMVKEHNPAYDYRIKKAIKEGLDGINKGRQYQIITKTIRGVLVSEIRDELSKEHVDSERVYDLFDPVKQKVMYAAERVYIPNETAYINKMGTLLRNVETQESRKELIEFIEEAFIMCIAYEIGSTANDPRDKLSNESVEILEAKLYLEPLEYNFTPEQLAIIDEELQSETIGDIDAQRILSQLETEFPKVREYYTSVAENVVK